MMRTMLPLSTLMLGICTVTSHDTIYSGRPAWRSKDSYTVTYSLSPPTLIKYPYYIAKPYFVGYPGIYVHHPVTTAATTEAPVATTAGAKEDNSDLYGCGTDYGPWWTPDYCRRYLLHWSATQGNITLAENLLRAGRDINLQHNVQRTALHIAAHWGRATMVRFLLRRGADPNLLDMWDFKAVELAELRKCEEEEYSKTWRLSCTGAESNYPATIAILKAGCEMTSCVYPYHCVNKECIKLHKNHHKNQG